MRSVFLLLLFSPSPLLPLCAGADPCVSGVAVGGRPGPYSFLVATGPQRGQQTCYVCEQDKKPTAIVFARHTSAPLGKLLAKLDAETAARKDAGFKAWMTLLADTADLDGLAKWAQKQGLRAVPVGVFEDAAGPPAYKLAADADVTVLLFVGRKVVANFALRAGELTDAKVAEVATTLAKLFEK
ncbi:MAG TPA: hypothetical protein VFG68_05690 [Fimbriiglobus sp.]|nr:hypothetical protein [Fimbriiglobus sp.]